MLLISRRTAEQKGVSDLQGVVKEQIPVVTLSGSGEFNRRLMAGMEREGSRLNFRDKLDYFSDCVAAVRACPVAAVVPWTSTEGEPDQDQFLRWRIPFLDDYSRELVLAWNPFRMSRRGFAPAHESDYQSLVLRIKKCLNDTVQKAEERLHAMK
jgi:hypothetical protein